MRRGRVQYSLCLTGVRGRGSPLGTLPFGHTGARRRLTRAHPARVTIVGSALARKLRRLDPVASPALRSTPVPSPAHEVDRGPPVDGSGIGVDVHGRRIGNVVHVLDCGRRGRRGRGSQLSLGRRGRRRSVRDGGGRRRRRRAGRDGLGGESPGAPGREQRQCAGEGDVAVEMDYACTESTFGAGGEPAEPRVTD